jgi:UDPglucose 6-dehydrogenase
LAWSFHPTDENELVEEVAGFWRKLGVKATVNRTPTSKIVQVSSRLLAAWWLDELGLGRNCYEQRLPDLIWDEPDEHKLAVLAGLWLGDGSWSYVSGGPSVVLEYGTVSRELADGMLRLLADLGIVARLKVGRTAKSTTDTFYLVVSGADQVERLLELVPKSSRRPILASIARQAKRIAPTGYRRHSNAAWVRVVDIVRRPYSGWVYSLEVPPTHAFVTTGGLVVSNCFPKDISFLKLLAGNSGYHFQLLNAVIEVNELQKRRLVSKLQKHLGSLAGKSIALLGLAFKPNTDDLREAPSIVLASRLLAEGADVRAWDPVVDGSSVLRGITVCESVLDAVRGADAAVIVTEWDELRELARPEVRDAMRNPLVVDGRNLLDPAETTKAGFVYEGIGRATSHFGGLPETEEPELPSQELQEPGA